MLYTIVAVLVILWILGLVTSTTMSGLIHILLVIAIVVVLLIPIRIQINTFECSGIKPSEHSLGSIVDV